MNERYALPSTRYNLSVHNLHKAHLESLDILVKAYIKKWLNIPSRGVSDIDLFHPYMLNIKQPSTLYLQGHAGNHTSMKIKGDIIVNASLQYQVSREAHWTKKSSSVVACEENDCNMCGKRFVPDANTSQHMECHSISQT